MQPFFSGEKTCVVFAVASVWQNQGDFLILVAINLNRLIMRNHVENDRTAMASTSLMVLQYLTDLFDDDKDFKNKNNMFMCVDLFNQADFFKIYSTKPLKSQTCKIDLLANSRRRSPADFSPTSSPLPLPCSSSGFNSKETCSDEVDPYGCKKQS